MSKEWRPWGYFEVLHTDESVWLKRLVVDAGQSLSVQRHAFRRELWYPLQNGGRAIINGVSLDLLYGKVYDVPEGMVHRIINDTTDRLYIIEWAVGRPDETDIERLE